MVSVIIPVKNEAGTIDRCLKGVFAQECEEPFEVIVIDSGSSDDTVTRCQAYPVRLYEIPAESFNHGATRNLGTQWARGAFVVFTTADSWPSTNAWLANMVDLLKGDPQIAAVYGMQVAPPEENVNPLEQWESAETARLQRRIQEVASPEAFRSLSSWGRRWVSNFDNCTSCIRAEVLRAIPFPESPYGEDMLWCKEALLQGYRVVYEPAALIYHYHHCGWRYAVRRFFIDQVVTAEHFGHYYCATLPGVVHRSVRQSLACLHLLRSRGLSLPQLARWAGYNSRYYGAMFWGFYLGGVLARHRDGAGLAPWERAWLPRAQALWATAVERPIQRS